MTDRGTSYLSGRLLARNAFWNFGGLAAPMLVALLAIPTLVEGLGKERFGLLAIIWMGVGYFSLFDMGLGRALTKLIAERLAGAGESDFAALVWTALSLILALGLAGAAVVWLGAAPIAIHVLNLKEGFETEAIAALRVLAAGIPLVVVTSALIGILEAHQRFATVMAVRVPLGVLTYVVPLSVLQFTPSLVWITAGLLGARLLACLSYFMAASSVCPELKRPRRVHRKHIYPLFRFGAWLTVTNIVGPVLVYFDRFLIGTMLSLTAVTYYVTPYEVLSRLQLFSRSLMGVLFPAFTTALSTDRRRLVAVYGQAARVLLYLMLPVTAAVFLFAPEALQAWLGEDFRRMATPVVRWLALGSLVNTLARMPLTILQSAGRPDLTAKTHLVELAPYAGVLWILTQRFGIVGAAAAWTLRALADAVILTWLALRRIPELKGILTRSFAIIGAVLAGFGLASLADSLPVRGALLLATTAVSAAFLRPILSRLTRAPRWPGDPAAPTRTGTMEISGNDDEIPQLR